MVDLMLARSARSGKPSPYTGGVPAAVRAAMFKSDGWEGLAEWPRKGKTPAREELAGVSLRRPVIWEERSGLTSLGEP
jgi:hypothetical protein